MNTRQTDSATSNLLGIRYQLLRVDRPWSEYPLGTKAHSCIGGYWMRVKRGWQWNGKHGTFPTPGGEACGACIELPLPNENSGHTLQTNHGG